MGYRLLPPDVLRVGQPVLFALRDKTGGLLVPKGTMVESDEQLLQLTERELYVDEQDGEALRRAIGGKLDNMLRENQTIGRMANARADAADLLAPLQDEKTPRRLADPVRSWSDLQVRLATVLRDPAQPDFASRLQAGQRALLDLYVSDPDDALLLLVHEATREYRDYSTSHAMLVAVLCELAARHVGAWSPAQRASLRCAALTMNVAMTTLQNQLAKQEGPLSAQQREEVAAHPRRSAEALRAAGIDDALWLAAVEHHHDAPPGPLDAMPIELQFARLIRRADVFAARFSPRKRRAAMSATAAAKAAYLDENGQPDPAGSAIIKATGLYPPGCLVALASRETAIVLRRGRRANEPIVASIVNPMGIAIADPSLRQTRLPAYKVTGGIAPHKVKVRVNLDRLLRLT